MAVIQHNDNYKSKNSLNYDLSPPHIIKYMGSKRKILDFVVESILDIYTPDQYVCDLFAGAANLSGALRNAVPIISNDIQCYSSILANTYLSDYNWSLNKNILSEIIDKAENKVTKALNLYPDYKFVYNNDLDLKTFQQLEKKQQELINHNFEKLDHHLFTKYYSGTYWNYNQCLWIDAFRAVADDYKGTPVYYIILSSLMFAMAYNSQSTGHYAQYRDADGIKSMKDILIYRKKEILPMFKRKFEELQSILGKNEFKHKVLTMDYIKCLEELPENSLIYSDPPYCFVHYSRFYHALETLVRYDYPEVLYKGRYRTDRHQSPFCIRTKVADAFSMMFQKIKLKNSNLVLSYSNTGMINFNDLFSLAESHFGNNYDVSFKLQDYQHSTMGRRYDKEIPVQEALIVAKKN